MCDDIDDQPWPHRWDDTGVTVDGEVWLSVERVLDTSEGPPVFLMTPDRARDLAALLEEWAEEADRIADEADAQGHPVR